MAVPLLEIEGTGTEIAKRLADYAEQRLHIYVYPSYSESGTLRDTRPIADILAEIAARVSPEDVTKLPIDFTDQLDHYIYESPKR